MASQFESTFTVDGVEYEVEWEMDCSIPVWSLVGDDTCHAPNLPQATQDKLDELIYAYMDDWYRGMDEYP